MLCGEKTLEGLSLSKAYWWHFLLPGCFIHQTHQLISMLMTFLATVLPSFKGVPHLCTYLPSLNLTNQTCISQEKMMPMMMRMNQEECVSSLAVVPCQGGRRHVEASQDWNQSRRRCRPGVFKRGSAHSSATEGKEFALFARTINYSMKVMLQMRKIFQLH